MKITRETFFKNTFAEFTPTRIPNRNPDFISESGSRYWFFANGVIRKSDHWGMVADCYWTLKEGEVGFAHWKDFEKRPEHDNCLKCGAPIPDAQHLKKVLNMQEAPKYCEVCRRDMHEYRKKGVISRQEKGRWDNSIIENWPFVPERNDNNDQYDIFHIGGREFGPYGGASHTGKKLVFVNKNWDYSQPALIRLMEKKAINKEQSEDINEYVVIDPAQDKTVPQKHVYYAVSYHKTTFKGMSRDRNQRYDIEGEYETILSGGGGARSGRFGNFWELIIGENVNIETQTA